MALSLNKPKLDNLTNEIWKSAERLRGEFKAMLDTSDRTASRVIANLMAQRLVTSPSCLGVLEPGLPFFSLKYRFLPRACRQFFQRRQRQSAARRSCKLLWQK